MTTPTHSSHDAGGHYTTSGVAVLAVGLFALLVDGYATLTNAPTGFIDREAMAVMSLAFIVVGIAMIRHGRTLGDS